jgi:hypothetical protein
MSGYQAETADTGVPEPRPFTSVTGVTAPLDRSTCLTFPFAKNPMD